MAADPQYDGNRNRNLGSSAQRALDMLEAKVEEVKEQEFSRMVEQVKRGRMVIGVDRGKARHFFMQIPAGAIKRETGESLAVERVLLWTVHLLGWISLFASCIVAVFGFGWWSVAFIPVAIILWMANTAKSVFPNSGLGFLSILLIAAAVAIPLQWFPNTLMAIAVFLLALSLWASRLLYVLTPPLLRGFILRNRKAYELIGKELHFKTIGE
jgi:hypothetical protein